MTSHDLLKLYDAIEVAVKDDAPVRFPVDVSFCLQVGTAPIGPTFTAPDLFWSDENGNVYQAWMQIEYRYGDVLPGFYVKGTRTLDQLTSGKTSMIRPENRYRSKI